MANIWGLPGKEVLDAGAKKRVPPPIKTIKTSSQLCRWIGVPDPGAYVAIHTSICSCILWETPTVTVSNAPPMTQQLSINYPNTGSRSSPFSLNAGVTQTAQSVSIFLLMDSRKSIFLNLAKTLDRSVFSKATASLQFHWLLFHKPQTWNWKWTERERRINHLFHAIIISQGNKNVWQSRPPIVLLHQLTQMSHHTRSWPNTRLDKKLNSHENQEISSYIWLRKPEKER